MVVDHAVVKRCAADRPCRRRIMLAAAWVTDSLPFLCWAVTEIFWRDNSTTMVMSSMWIFFVYMVTAVGRLPLNIALLASHRLWALLAGVALSLALEAAFVYGMAVTRTDYVVNRVEIVSDRLPASFDGYTIVQISDMHIGSMVRPRRELERIVGLCNAQEADMVAYCGDLINIRHSETAAVADILKRLRARDGVYSVLGNHDLGVYVRDTISQPVEENTRRVSAAERSLGWRLLDDRTEYLHRGEDSVSLTGISFRREWAETQHSSDLPAAGIEKAYVGVPHGVFNITLSHVPQMWDDIVAAGYGDLTLSGHVHSMQMKIPVGKRGISPAALRYRRWSGLYTERGHSLYVNDGVGCVLFPMRVGARPEITVLVLVSER